MVEQTIRRFYLITALYNASIAVIAATYVLFLQARGLSLAEVNMVNFFFFVTLVLSEVPTGIFADMFGRKISCLIACVVFALSMIIYGLANSFWGFVVAEVIGAVGNTFASGAMRAWFIDRLHHHGHSESHGSYIRKSTQIRQVVNILAAIIGAATSRMWLPLPWFVGAVLFVVTGIAILMTKEEYFIRRTYTRGEIWAGMTEIGRASLYAVRANDVIRGIMIMTAVQVCTCKTPDMQWQPLFASLGKEVVGSWAAALLGILWAFMMGSLILGAHLVPRLIRWSGGEVQAMNLSQKIIGIFITATGLLVVCADGRMSTLVFLVSFALFLCHEVGRGAFEPLKLTRLHAVIGSRERATIESADSMAHHFGGAVGLLAGSIVVTAVGMPWTWVIFGGFLIAFSFWRGGRMNAVAG